MEKNKKRQSHLSKIVNEFISEQTFLNAARAAEVAPFARLLMMCLERLVLLFESVCQFSHLLRKDVGPPKVKNQRASWIA